MMEKTLVERLEYIRDEKPTFNKRVTLNHAILSLKVSQETNATLEANQKTIADLIEALEDTQKLFDEALPKFDWGSSFLDANAIRLLNEVPIKVRAALSRAKEQS